MKKAIFKIFTLVILFIAVCHGQPLQKVIFYPDIPDLKQEWNFNTEGLLSNIKNGDGEVMRDFTYDVNGNLVTMNIYNQPWWLPDFPPTMTFTYDVDNHITTVNGVTCTYENATNSYLIGNLADAYNRYFLTAEGLFKNEASHYYDSDQEQYVNQSGLNCSYVDENLASRSNTEDFMTTYTSSSWEHVAVTNPLKAAMLPALKALAVCSFNESYWKWADADYCSDHLPVSLRYEISDPESSDYLHELNAAGMPFKTHVLSYYLGEYEGETVSAIYYYQGDVIPD